MTCCLGLPNSPGFVDGVTHPHVIVSLWMPPANHNFLTVFQTWEEVDFIAKREMYSYPIRAHTAQLLWGSLQLGMLYFKQRRIINFGKFLAYLLGFPS